MDKEKNNFPPVSFDEFSIPSYEEWKEEATKLLKGGEFDKKLLTKTFEGITLQPIYTAKDVEESNALPGVPMYQRGTQEDGYLVKNWDTAQEILADTPEKAHELIREELDNGSNAVYLELSPETKGIVNQKSKGVHLLNREQTRVAFDKIDLKKMGTYINTGYSSYPFVYMLADAKSCFEGAHGHIGGDPLSTFASSGELPRPIEKLYDEMAEAVKYVSKAAPAVHTVLANSKVFADGGADSVTELACVLAEVSEYMSALTERGVSADDAAKSIGISLTLGSNYFMEIAKIRAARVLFAQITKDFGASEDAQKVSIHGITSEFNKTKYDPYVNVLRISTESFSGVVAGVDALTILPFDCTIGKSDMHARRISRNISIMMSEEFSLKSPVDPSGGSWYVETLTNQFIDATWTKFMEYENAGGFYKSLVSGMVQEGIAKNLANMKSKLNTRALRSVGTNMYANVGETLLERECKINKTAVDKTSTGEVKDDVAGLMESFNKGLNMLSVYEKINTGAVEKCPIIKPSRLSEDFEALREKTSEIGGVTVRLLNMGPVSQHKARAEFSTGFFEVGTFKILGDKMFDSVDDAVNHSASENPDVCVICSTDDTYPELIPAIAKGIKAKNNKIQVIVAGAPAAEYKDSYLEAGVDDFIHVRANCLEVLSKVQTERGNK
ncbi:methylmalonyl-CoA mutase family protein [Tyzzerella sp. OttesenSCG-928-J15]|nr:methylmalonyl-CoA mutase family protein [Tyzzerella sp. OttesenSCG-928-J15]